tara:strand:- start:183 stop:1640 length:1458 start_codon:yes stop_codon:yes gene_type:complete
MNDLTALEKKLNQDELSYLDDLIRSWDLLADLSFADLLLCAPDLNIPVSPYTVVAHVRPTTSRSIYRTKMEGMVFQPGERPFLDQARKTLESIDGGLLSATNVERIRTLCIPVNFNGKVIAILSRDFSPDDQRVAGELEMTYFSLFRKLGVMISQGKYPFKGTQVETEFTPRVSDGVIELDARGYVRFASPNSVSVLSRLKVDQVEGKRLGVEELKCESIPLILSTQRPQSDEISLGGQTVTLKGIPLLEGEEMTGALLLIRDISELRRRDKLIRSKDSTIAEIHHRVKNNLQTISSLLHLQSRRLVAEEAQEAINDSVRRIRSIAVVHEILSHNPEASICFDDIIKPLVRLVSEGLTSPEITIDFMIEGDAVNFPSAETTALAVALNELLQNTIQHGFRDFLAPEKPKVIIHFGSTNETFQITVTDNGRGLPETFDEKNFGLGLTIVRNLIETDLGGNVELFPKDPSGTVALIRIPQLGENSAL